MKLSKSFLKEYINIDCNVKTLAEDMTKVGNEYESCGKLINATNLITGEVLECSNHPDSDHLHVCLVNIGDRTLQIVCGAPNVRKGIKVIVAQVGAELPGDFKIKKSVIRGIESNGMLCSLGELGIENKFLTEEDKTGIHVLPSTAKVGSDPIKTLDLDDEVIDFELTPNRGDLLSIMGMAYEVGAIYSKRVKDIDLSHGEEKENVNDSFNLNIDTDNCSLFLAKKVLNVEIKDSPSFIKSRLISSGIRPINNVVDISNYVMLETGQPLHFYDSDKLGNNIKVRMAKKNESLTTLDGIERLLTEDDIVITNGSKAVGLAGVMGGYDTEITEDTKNIIIESAIFDSVKIRLTSKKILRSEASNRFEKGLDPNRTYMAIERCCNLLEKYASCKILKGTVTYDKTVKEDKIIKITPEQICNVLGFDIKTKDIINVFNRLGFKNTINNGLIIVGVPTRRLDINIKEDLIEEVGRVYGVDNITGKLPILAIKPGYVNKEKRQISDRLIDLGLNEVITYTLISDKDINKYTLDSFNAIKVLDSISEDRTTLRYSLLPSLVNVYEYNKARNIKDISIFEIGKRFYQQNDKYIEEEHLAMLLSGNYFYETSKNKAFDFYMVKGIVENLLNYLGYKNRYEIIANNDIPKEFHPGQSAVITVDHHFLGYIGRIHPSIHSDEIYLVEISLKALFDNRISKIKYKEISKYPSVEKDVAFIMNKQIVAQDVMNSIKKVGGKTLVDANIFDIYEGNKLAADQRSIAYKLKFESSEKTLSNEEVDVIFRKIIAEVVKTYNAILRDN